MQVMRAVRQAQEMQQKVEKHARKLRKQARHLERAQKDRNDWEDIAEYRRQQWVKATTVRDHKQVQMSQLAREKETVRGILHYVCLRTGAEHGRCTVFTRRSGRTIYRIRLKLVLWRFTASTTCYNQFPVLHQSTRRWDLR